MCAARVVRGFPADQLNKTGSCANACVGGAPLSSITSQVWMSPVSTNIMRILFGCRTLKRIPSPTGFTHAVLLHGRVCDCAQKKKKKVRRVDEDRSTLFIVAAPRWPGAVCGISVGGIIRLSSWQDPRSHGCRATTKKKINSLLTPSYRPRLLQRETMLLRPVPTVEIDRTDGVNILLLVPPTAKPMLACEVSTDSITYMRTLHAWPVSPCRLLQFAAVDGLIGERVQVPQSAAVAYTVYARPAQHLSVVSVIFMGLEHTAGQMVRHPRFGVRMKSDFPGVFSLRHLSPPLAFAVYDCAPMQADWTIWITEEPDGLYLRWFTHLPFPAGEALPVRPLDHQEYSEISLPPHATHASAVRVSSALSSWS